MSAIFSAVVAALAVSATEIQSGKLFDKAVSVRGSVVAAVRDDLDSAFNWVVLETPEGKVYGATDNSVWPIEKLRKLTDAEVEFTGVVNQFTSWRRFLGYQLTFGGEDNSGFKILDPAPEDPFSVPDLTPFSNTHRRKTHGQVIAVTRGHFFIPTLNHAGKRMIVRVCPAEGEKLPEVNSFVTVSGFPRWGQHYLQMNNALWRPDDNPVHDPEIPEAIDVKSLFSEKDGHLRANSHYCGRVIRIIGIVEASPMPNPVSPEIFFINCNGTSIKVDFSGLKGFKPPEIGSTASATGICYADFINTDDSSPFPNLDGFILIPRTATDIVVLKNPPWLTPSHILAVAGVLFGIFGLFAGWMIALRIVATRRAQELAREEIASAKAELKVEERTRLAVELHDSLSQTLTGVALQIDAASGSDSDGAKKFLATARNMLSSCRQELNGCLWDLRSRTFEEKDMTEAVQRTLAPHVGSAKLTVRFNVPREKLSEQSAHAILRIIRELGTNAVKHGHARNIKIAGEFHDDTISFSVLDDGCGFDTATAPGPAQGHFGLQGVHERLNEFNGTIRCDSEPGCGAKFTVVLHTASSKTE